MNLRPSGYEPDELPDCSTPRQVVSGKRVVMWGCWPDLATTRSPTPFGAVPWALRGFTAEFGMGSGGSRALWSPGRASSPDVRCQMTDVRGRRSASRRSRVLEGRLDQRRLES